LYAALTSDLPVVPLFIFDSSILSKLERDDARVSFLHETLSSIDATLREKNDSALLVKHGNPIEVWAQLIANYDIGAIYTNRDYEPYARERDATIEALCQREGIAFHTYKDQVLFEPGEALKGDGTPYTVYTPYSKKCFSLFKKEVLDGFPSEEVTQAFHRFAQKPIFPSLIDIGFKQSSIKVLGFDIASDRISQYDETRDRPAMDATSKLSPHLRFGTVSIRQVARKTLDVNTTFIKELFWREFFMQILFYFPQVVKGNFRPKYDRMVVASFLTKHLLIDWRWGEAYFAEKLLDFDLSANNGNWQWAAGTGCDASPYFRVFNPTSQWEKFDSNSLYIKKWVPEFGTEDYPAPMVEHKMARLRAIEEYKKGIALYEAGLLPK